MGDGSEDRVWDKIRNHLVSNKEESGAREEINLNNKDKYKAVILKGNSTVYER